MKQSQLEVHLSYTAKISLPKVFSELNDDQLTTLGQSYNTELFKILAILLGKELTVLSNRIDNNIISSNTNELIFNSGRDKGERDKVLQYLNISELAKLELLNRKK